jgi:hypothetical protein
MKKRAQHLIAEVQCRRPRVAMTIGIDLGDVWAVTALSKRTAKRTRFRTGRRFTTGMKAMAKPRVAGGRTCEKGSASALDIQS